MRDSNNLDMARENTPLLTQHPPKVNQVIQTTGAMGVARSYPNLNNSRVIYLHALQNRWVDDRLPMWVVPLPQRPSHGSMDCSGGLTHVYH